MAENENVAVAIEPVATKKEHYGSKKQSKLIADIVTYVVLVFGTFLMLYPFWWMFIASIDISTTDIQTALVWWPSAGKSTYEYWGAKGYAGLAGFFRNYTALLDVDNGITIKVSTITFWQIIGNTLLYSIVPVVVGVITSTSAAFAFSKIEWIGRDVVFMVLLSAVMIPGPSIMIIQYCMYTAFGWISNETGWMVMIIPGLFGSIMTAFFVRQFLFGMPTSIIEAAKIDGAGYWRIFWSFILPLAIPAVMAQAILSFMGCWNNYMGCYIMLGAYKEAWNLPVLVSRITNQASMTGDGNYSFYGSVFAGSVLSVLPVLILFGIFQKQIMGSLMLTGSKE